MDILLHILYNTNAYEYILSWHHFIYNLSLKQLSSVRNRICQSLQSLSNRSNLTFNIEYIGFIEISDNRSIWSILSYHQFENRVVNIWSGFFFEFHLFNGHQSHRKNIYSYQILHKNWIAHVNIIYIIRISFKSHRSIIKICISLIPLNF